MSCGCSVPAASPSRSPGPRGGPRGAPGPAGPSRPPGKGEEFGRLRVATSAGETEFLVDTETTPAGSRPGCASYPRSRPRPLPRDPPRDGAARRRRFLSPDRGARPWRHGRRVERLSRGERSGDGREGPAYRGGARRAAGSPLGREGRAASLANHPGIVNVTDFGTSPCGARLPHHGARGGGHPRPSPRVGGAAPAPRPPGGPPHRERTPGRTRPGGHPPRSEAQQRLRGRPGQHQDRRLRGRPRAHPLERGASADRDPERARAGHPELHVPGTGPGASRTSAATSTPSAACSSR